MAGEESDGIATGFIDDAVIARLLEERQRLVDRLQQNTAFLSAFGADMSTINDPIPHRVKKRGRGRPDDTDLDMIVQATVQLAVMHRKAPTIARVAEYLGRSEQTVRNQLHEHGWTWDAMRDEVARRCSLPPRRP